MGNDHLFASIRALFVVLALGSLGACSGDIESGDEGPAAGDPAQAGASGSAAGPGAGAGGVGPGAGAGPGALPPGSNPGGIDPVCDQDSVPGVTPLMKLSTLQYKNTVRDLLAAVGASSVTSGLQARLDAVPDDSLGDSFRVLDNRISLEHVQAYFDVGVAVGDAVAGDSGLLASVAGDCAMTTPLSTACAEGFARRFGELAYRRPLSDAEVAELTALNDGQRTSAEAVRAMIVVAMMSPRFVNHLEVDGQPTTGDDLLQLTSYEIASRLSYAFWQTMPDAELLAAAADGSLATEAGFSEQLDRVFRDDRTRDTLWQFWNEWLRLERFTGFETTRPAFQAMLDGLPVGGPGHDYYGDMVDEIRDLTELFTFERTSTLADLLSTDESVTRSADLAELYGVEPWDGSGAYPRLPAGTRAGLLQRGALLVSNLETTNPFHRGALVRQRVLCDPLAQPDPNSLPPGSLDPPPITSDQTTRERFQAKIEGNDICAGCHDQFAAIGYALESFDALGRYRDTERVFDEQTGELLAELAVDPSGVPRIDPRDDTPVQSAAELNQRVVDSEKVEACLAQRYFSFILRRTPTSQTMDSCGVDDLAEAMKDPQAGLIDAFQRLARHSSFFLRKVGPQ